MKDTVASMRNRLTVGMKIGVLLILMVAVAGVTVGSVYYYQSQVETLGNSINTAGQQRMLTQRMARFSNRLATGEAGTETQQKLNQSIQTYDSNLRKLEEGGTKGGARLDAAPGPVMDELTAEKESWEEYRQRVQTIRTTEPTNPAYTEAVGYVATNNERLLAQSNAVVVAYVDLDNSSEYANEINIAGRQRMLSQRIAKTVQFIDRNEEPGETTPAVERAKENLSAYVTEYNNALDALDNGGTHRGSQLQPAPPSVQDDIETVRATWEPFQANATAVSTTAKFNPEFVTALEYVRGNADQLLTTSDELVTAFATLSAERIGFMKALLLWLFALNLVVFAGGFVAVRRQISDPMAEIAALADAIAAGNLDVAIDSKTPASTDGESRDEVAKLGAAFREMHDTLTTVAAQIEAMADQEFDADVLDEEIPGEFGETVQTDLKHLIDDMEQTATEAQQAREQAETARQEAETLATTLDQKAQEYRAVMEQAAAGDLTSRMDPESESEAMSQIGETFNAMLDELAGTLREIQTFADEVAESSTVVTASTEETQQASTDIAHSVQEISASAGTQEELLTSVLEEVNTLSATIEEVAASANEVATVADQAAERGQTGQEFAASAIEEMDRIETQADETVTEVEQLEAEMEEIGEIVDLIADIAEQTNILALNASIEAARAGEAGEGFAVVANEVKQLAGEASEATQQIEDRISAVQTTSTEAAERMRTTSQQVSEGAATIEQALDAVDDIVAHVGDANDGIQEISEATDEQASSAEQIVTMVEDATDGGREITDESQNVSAAAEQQTNSLTEVADRIQSLSEQAQDLDELLTDFDTGQQHGRAGGTGESPAAADGGY